MPAVTARAPLPELEEVGTFSWPVADEDGNLTRRVYGELLDYRCAPTGHPKVLVDATLLEDMVQQLNAFRKVLAPINPASSALGGLSTEKS